MHKTLYTMNMRERIHWNQASNNNNESTNNDDHERTLNKRTAVTPCRRNGNGFRRVFLRARAAKCLNWTSHDAWCLPRTVNNRASMVACGQTRMFRVSNLAKRTAYMLSGLYEVYFFFSRTFVHINEMMNKATFIKESHKAFAANDFMY